MRKIVQLQASDMDRDYYKARIWALGRDPNEIDLFCEAGARVYTKKIDAWLNYFARGKKQNSKKYASVIIRYLIRHGKAPHKYGWVPLREMRRELVIKGNREAGKPRERPKKGPIKINYPQTLLSLLNQLESDGIIRKTKSVENFKSSRSDKKKESTFYTLTIFELPSINKDEDKTSAMLRKEWLERRQAEKNVIEWMKEAGEIAMERDAAASLLSDYGISDPISEIKQRYQKMFGPPAGIRTPHRFNGPAWFEVSG